MRLDGAPGQTFPLLAGSFVLLAAVATSTAHAAAQSIARTPPAHVGAVMALLATFDDAGALPPESSPDANRLIKSLIQFQSALMKSDAEAVRRMAHDTQFAPDGWTSRSLEAAIDYADRRTIWSDPAILQAFAAFNVGPEDFALVARTYRHAQERLAAQGRDVHTVYAARRRSMPGAASPTD